VDIETTKITNACESPVAGILRRIVAQPGETLPVGALIAVVAPADESEAAIDAFVAEFQATYVPPSEDDEAAAVLRLSTVETPLGAIRVGRAGPEDGVPVVLIHGYAGDLNNWLFNIEALSAAAPVIAIDLPGHGGSTKSTGDGGLTTLAAAVAATLRALKVPHAHLVGHSLGAATAARVAIDNPGMARSLVLIAPAYLSVSPVSEEFLTGIIDAQRARDLKPFIEMLVADPAMVTKDMVEDVMRFKRLDGSEEALTALRDRMVDGADGAGLRADLSAIPSAVVVASKHDRIVGVPDETCLPAGFKIVWIDDAGHMPHLEKAAEVNAVLLEVVGRR